MGSGVKFHIEEYQIVDGKEVPYTGIPELQPGQEISKMPVVVIDDVFVETPPPGETIEKPVTPLTRILTGDPAIHGLIGAALSCAFLIAALRWRMVDRKAREE